MSFQFVDNLSMVALKRSCSEELLTTKIDSYCKPLVGNSNEYKRDLILSVTLNMFFLFYCNLIFWKAQAGEVIKNYQLYHTISNTQKFESDRKLP